MTYLKPREFFNESNPNMTFKDKKNNFHLSSPPLKLKKTLPLIILFSILFITIVGNQESFAEKIKYEPNKMVVRNNPTVCSIEPLDPDLTKNQIEKFATQSKVSVSEWQQHLQTGLVKNDLSKWEINYKLLKYDEVDSDAIIQCDIFVVFSKTPHSLDFWNILGLAIPNFETGKTVIEIYYLTPQLCDSGERKREGNIIYIFQEPCYGEMMVSSQLGSVIRHELGHAFGLGHYMSTDEGETIDWNKGRNPSPSIMVEVSYEYAKDHKIMPRDIQKLRTIYGDDGFFLNSKEKENLTLLDPNFAEQKFTTFENSLNKFSIKYPEKWFIEDSILHIDDYSRLLLISDEQGSMNKTLSVSISNNTMTSSSDQINLNILIDKEKENCDSRSVEENGFICENFVLLDSKFQNDENSKVYTINYFWNDGTNYHVSYQNYVAAKDKTWRITGEGILAPFLLANDVIDYSINSFNFDSTSFLQIDREDEEEPQIDLSYLKLEE